ncbi:MAG: MoxR family ATPase [Spirochaetaceae bacterium]
MKSIIEKLIIETSKGFIGNSTVIEDAVLAFVAGLHILIEDISGVGKTTLVKCLAKSAGLELGRIQFTPDLLPGDITGMTIWDPVQRQFNLKKGAIFSELILADEINRASPRTQSALLEAMEEKTVSIDGKSFTLPNPFIVIATKNPSFYLGTFDMPESQIDRFGILIKPGYPSIENEKKILLDFKNIEPVDNVNKVSDISEITSLIKYVHSVNISDDVLEYIVNIGNKTRNHTDVKYGLSTRGLKHLIKFSQSKAIFSDRDYLIPEDVIYSVKRVFPHKIQLTSEAILNNKSINLIISEILKKIAIPVGIN